MKMGNGTDYTTAYDENGNIKRMQQWGMKIAKAQIDNLGYEYDTWSNKLLNVTDQYNDPNTKLGDFKDGPNGGTGLETTANDYQYDVNGNMIVDLNKNIYGPGFVTGPGITYNHLNLPQEVIMVGKGTIKYVYDAAGNKLQKIVQETGKPDKVTIYIAGMVYEDNVLQFAGQEEGRIRFKPATNTTTADFAYDYFIKDHLGNVRMVLTEEAQADQYPAATMEDATTTAEETYYSNLNTTRVASPSGYPANTPSGNAKVARVSGGTNLADHKIGPAILLKVMSGDKFNVSVNSWWKKDVGTPVNSPNSAGAGLLEALINGVSGLGGSKFTPSQLTTAGAFVTGISTFLTPQPSSTGTSGKPKAFLNWILFDEQFNYVSSNSGFEAVGGNDVYTAHTQSNLPVTKNGFLYIYTSNETPNVDVFFDNLQVTHTRGQMLEETHYYPFGLTMAGISSKAAGSMKNVKRFNGGTELQSDEFTDGSGLELYSTTFRSLDPQLGIFWQIDPFTELHFDNSPYSFVRNNPILYSDPMGLDTFRLNGGGTFKLHMKEGDVLAWTTEKVVSYYTYDPENKNAVNGFVEQGRDEGTQEAVVVVASGGKKNNTNNYSLPLAGVGLGMSYAGKNVFNRNSWFDMTKWKTYKQNYYGNQWRSGSSVKAAKGFSKNMGRGIKAFGWGMGLWSQYNIINDAEMSTNQKLIETGVNIVSTFGGIYGAAVGIGWESGRVLTQNSWYRMNVRPLIQDVCGWERDEVPKTSTGNQKLIENLEFDSNYFK